VADHLRASRSPRAPPAPRGSIRIMRRSPWAPRVPRAWSSRPPPRSSGPRSDAIAGPLPEVKRSCRRHSMRFV